MPEERWRNQARDAEDHLRRGPVLLRHAVDREAEAQRVWVRDLVRGDDPGAGRREAVLALGEGPLPAMPAVARRDVVDDGVAEDVRHRVALAHPLRRAADDDAELAFPVELARDLLVVRDLRLRPITAVGGLMKMTGCETSRVVSMARADSSTCSA
jgi:hypothetical protein